MAAVSRSGGALHFSQSPRTGFLFDDGAVQRVVDENIREAAVRDIIEKIRRIAVYKHVRRLSYAKQAGIDRHFIIGKRIQTGRVLPGGPDSRFYHLIRNAMFIPPSKIGFEHFVSFLHRVRRFIVILDEDGWRSGRIGHRLFSCGSLSTGTEENQDRQEKGEHYSSHTVFVLCLPSAKITPPTLPTASRLTRCLDIFVQNPIFMSINQHYYETRQTYCPLHS